MPDYISTNVTVVTTSAEGVMDVYRYQDILRRHHLREFVYPQPSLFVDISDFCLQLIAHGRPGMYLVSEVLENSVDGVHKSDSACLLTRNGPPLGYKSLSSSIELTWGLINREGRTVTTHCTIPPTRLHKRAA